MLGYNLVLTLGVGSLIAFSLFFIFHRLFRWGGKMSSLATAALMLLIYIPLAVTHWEGIDVFAIHFAFFMMIPYGLGIINGVQEERRLREGAENVKRGMHWIPGLIIVFFIMIAVVDSIIISFATAGLDGGLAKLLLPESVSEDVGKNVNSQFNGTIANDFQDEEKQFDKHVAKLNEQRQRGWKVAGGWDETPIVNKAATFRVKIKDKSGASISGAKVRAEFRRSNTNKMDMMLALNESTTTELQRGTYANRVTLPLAGCWKMRILVAHGDNQHETQGETEVATMMDGKLVLPECIEGEPDVDEKMSR